NRQGDVHRRRADGGSRVRRGFRAGCAAKRAALIGRGFFSARCARSVSEPAPSLCLSSRSATHAYVQALRTALTSRRLQLLPFAIVQASQPADYRVAAASGQRLARQLKRALRIVRLQQQDALAVETALAQPDRGDR